MAYDVLHSSFMKNWTLMSFNDPYGYGEEVSPFRSISDSTNPKNIRTSLVLLPNGAEHSQRRSACSFELKKPYDVSLAETILRLTSR